MEKNIFFLNKKTQAIMKAKRSIKLWCIFLTVISLLLFPISARETVITEKPHVVVFGYMNLTGDSTFNIPTDTATGILLFSL